MLNAVRSHLTYANVVATGVLFVALGGGAYALTGIPDRGGVYHACVDPKTGALRVVKSARSCRKTRTVTRGRRRVRIPGESAIAWNQQGPTGRPGANGANGVNGGTGPQGPGATGLSTTLPADTTMHTLITVSGLNIRGLCTSGGLVQVEVATSTGTTTLDASGTTNNASSSSALRTDTEDSASIGVGPTASDDMDVIARNTAVGNFVRIDLHGQGSNCHFWAMVTPSA
jgi:hypothetical protein